MEILLEIRNRMSPVIFKDNGVESEKMDALIEAEHLGLRVHQMAGWDEQAVKTALGFPDEFRVVVVFALGYEENPKNVWDELDERMRKKVERTRTRMPAVKKFYFSSFGEA